MMKKGMKKNKILDLLYRSFDEDLKEEEQKLLEEALKNSEALRKESAQIAAQRQDVSESAAQSFRPGFAERVMGRIDALGEKNALEIFYETLKAAFRRLALVGAIVLIILISFNLVTEDSLSSEEVLYAPEVTFEEILDLPLF